MHPTLLDDTDVKVVYDSQGVKREVLISYEKYQEIMEFLERHAYFYSQEVQERLQKSDEDLQAGRYIEVEAAEIDKTLEWLAQSGRTLQPGRHCAWLARAPLLADEGTDTV